MPRRYLVEMLRQVVDLEGQHSDLAAGRANWQAETLINNAELWNQRNYSLQIRKYLLDTP